MAFWPERRKISFLYLFINQVSIWQCLGFPSVSQGSPPHFPSLVPSIPIPALNSGPRVLLSWGTPLAITVRARLYFTPPLLSELSSFIKSYFNNFQKQFILRIPFHSICQVSICSEISKTQTNAFPSNRPEIFNSLCTITF